VKIKKFTARTELEAIDMVKEELGSDALVISIKKIQTKGLFGFLRKPSVEILAAYDETKLATPVASTFAAQLNSRQVDFESAKKYVQAAAAEELAGKAEKTQEQARPRQDSGSGLNDQNEQNEQDEKNEKIRMLQDMLLTTSDMLRRTQNQLSVAHHSMTQDRLYQNNLLQIFYDALRENDVNEDIAREILDELDNDSLVEKLDINFIVKIVYNSLTKIIGDPQGLLAEPSKGSPKMFAFIGPTGVGKTTTIAKLTADLTLNKGLAVGLITADTYRIAAIEQLKTYGDILGLDVAVAYKADDLVAHINEKRGDCDVILIDTAGRSHKNAENLTELQELLQVSDDIDKFLVLSLTTKFEDMVDIITTFSNICDFKIIFTKLDETGKMGNIVNICHKTGKKLSYITFGQNVPDDIKTIAPNEVAMRLLGLGE